MIAIGIVGDGAAFVEFGLPQDADACVGEHELHGRVVRFVRSADSPELQRPAALAAALVAREAVLARANLLAPLLAPLLPPLPPPPPPLSSTPLLPTCEESRRVAGRRLHSLLCAAPAPTRLCDCLVREGEIQPRLGQELAEASRDAAKR